jgi:hypothetical protein
MDVIGFLRVSLGSSTVQLHDSLGSRRACACSESGFSSQNGDRAWLYYRRAAFCCASFVDKRTQCKWYKEMFPVYCVKRFTAGSRNVTNVSLMTKRLKRRWGSGCDNSQQTSVQRVSTHWLSDGSSVSVLVEDMPRNKCFFPGSNITCFTFHISLVFKLTFIIPRTWLLWTQ